jgi:hypothetical protein
VHLCSSYPQVYGNLIYTHNEQGGRHGLCWNRQKTERPRLAGLDSSANVLGPEVTRIVNEFTTKKCKKLKDELPSNTGN